MIDNKHSFLQIPSTALYLMNYFESIGYDVVLHENWEELGTILTESSDYPYPMDPSFTPSYLGELGKGATAFALYLKKGDEVVATYAAKSHRPKTIADNLYEFYPNLEVQTLPEILDREDVDYYYSSCQWVHTNHLGKKLGVSLDLLKKHIIFDSPQFQNVDVNFAIHKINDSMKSYHLSKLFYSNSEPFAIKKDGGVGGAGSEEDREYNIVWTVKESFQSKVSEIKATYN
jgi:hypothetical protein